MYDKYEIKTYPESFQMDDSDTETEKIKSTIKMKKATYVNPNRFSDQVFQPECIFTKEKNNIFFYQSDSNESFKNKKFKSLNKENNNKNYDSDVINKKIFRSPINFVEEQFSYNYTTNEEYNNINNKKDNNISLNQRVCLNNYFQKKCGQVPKRTIKSYQSQFDVEKSDNFKVLSYRPENYESDNMKMNSKSKIIKNFQKEEGIELFYPSKRAQSPPSPLDQNNNFDKKEKVIRYQTPTLKFQSFFGSYTRPKYIKNNSQVKSISKIKKNQLEDFNIDKLIEIGDDSKKWKNILSFGKKINNIKKQNKNQLKYNSENERFRKKIKFNPNLEENEEKPENLSMAIPISQKKEVIKQNIKTNNNKIKTKNLIYHGQIKRKRNYEDTKTLNNQNKDINKPDKISKGDDKALNLNNEKILLDNVNNNNQININNNKTNNNNSNLTKFKKINPKQILKNREIFYNNNKQNQNSSYQQIIPNKTIPKNKIDMNVNDNKNYSTNNNQKNYKILEKRNFSKNTNMENDIKNDLSTKVLLIKVDNIMTNKKVIHPIKPTNKKSIIDSNNAEENNAIKYNKNNSNTNTKVKNQNEKKYNNTEFKIKDYYGYDERHNLEGPINNHSYYISVYSKKKVNQNSHSNE